eukprot:3461214-Rhodomonas_salina.1
MRKHLVLRGVAVLRKRMVLPGGSRAAASRSAALSPYASAMRCPVLPTRVLCDVRYGLRDRYAMSGIDMAYGGQNAPH